MLLLFLAGVGIQIPQAPSVRAYAALSFSLVDSSSLSFSLVDGASITVI